MPIVVVRFSNIWSIQSKSIIGGFLKFITIHMSLTTICFFTSLIQNISLHQCKYYSLHRCKLNLFTQVRFLRKNIYVNL